MNISDSQRIETKLNELGYKSAPESGADLIIVNACSVRQHAVDRIWGKIKKWQKQNKKIFITGCVLKEDKQKFINKGIGVFNISDLPKINIILDEHSDILLNNRISSKDNFLEYFNIKAEQNGKIAYIPIMIGCDNFCSYCAVPYTKGREVSRPMKDIIDEVNDAIKQGFKNILLLGQNVNSYCHSETDVKSVEESAMNMASDIRQTCLPARQGSCLPKGAKAQDDNKNFIELLNKIDKLPGEFKFNFMSSNPHDMGDELIKCFANLKKWPRELHLPMQSGDDEILKKMNRKYSTKQYLALIKNLKFKIKNLPDGKAGLVLTTDIIVGFPGETEKQFQNTYKLCQKIKFSKAFIGQYSPRPGTASSKMPDDVPAETKKERWLKLNALINKK